MVWRRWIRAIWAVAVLTLGVPVAALGCSPVRDYVRPSNFELVQIASAIVVATPIGEKDVAQENFFDRKVVFRVVQTVKGDAAGEIEVTGLTLGRTRPSNPHNILAPHPEAYMGPCNRMTLSKGASYVLFLQKRGQDYATLGYPFSRIDEDYAGEGSLWMRTIRSYLRLQNSEAPMAQIATLERMQAEILAKTTLSNDEKQQAIDIAFHLGAPSPWKPTEFLLAAYDDVKAGRPPRYRPRPSAFDAEQSEAAAFTGVIMEAAGLGDGKPAAPPRRDPRLTALLEMMIDGDHPRAMALFDTLAVPDAPADDLAMAIRFYAKNGRYRDAYRLIEDRAAPMITRLSQDEAWSLFRAIEEAQQESIQDKEPRRWRSESDIAARWPTLALKLTLVSEERFGEYPGYTETLKGVLGTDYRANPDLTLMLSGHLNEIGDWALAELTRKENLAASTGGPDDPLRLPMRIVMSWIGVGRDERDVPALTPAFCLGPAQRQMLFQDIGRLASTSGAHEILRFAASSAVDATDRRVLAANIPAWDKRYVADYGESWLKADPAMQKIANGRPVTAKDIEPLKSVVCPAA